MNNLIVKSMINELIINQGFTSVVKKTGLSGKTIRRILTNSMTLSLKTEMNLISFYCFCMVNTRHHTINELAA